jgi:hypothetical protein
VDIRAAFSVPLNLTGWRDIPPSTQIQTGMDQISIKRPNPKCRLFLKIGQERDLGAGVYLSEAPEPLPSPVTHCMNTVNIPVLIHTGKGGGG